MTLQERLRAKAKWVSSRIADLLDEAADALDARDAEIASLKETMEILEDPDAMAQLKASEADIAAGRVHDHEDVRDEFGVDRHPWPRPRGCMAAPRDRWGPWLGWYTLSG